jgi:hypothetical protein
VNSVLTQRLGFICHNSAISVCTQIDA